MLECVGYRNTGIAATCADGRPYDRKMGPNILFDKSFLQSLSTDESVWFDHFYNPVICPLFFVETLADLAKPPREGKSAEQEVAIIASKTPEWSGAPCYYHQHLCMWDLLGRAPPMNGQVPIAAKQVMREDGKLGAVAEYPPEAQAFARWHAERFADVEHMFAHRWRELVENIDLESLRAAMKSLGVGPKDCKTLADARKYAEWSVTAMTRSPGKLDAAMDLLGVMQGPRPHIRERWKRAGKPTLRAFAPYAAHVLAVEAFFAIGVAAHLIPAERPSNRVDVAYLFYAPFCHVFVSGDRLHRACAPHFLRADQVFVWGPDLKADLQTIDMYFKSLPEEIRSQPIYKLAKSVPEASGLTRELSARFAPGNLSTRGQIDLTKLSPEGLKKLAEHVQSWKKGDVVPEPAQAPEDAIESFSLERRVSRRRGSWLQVGPEVDDSQAREP